MARRGIRGCGSLVIGLGSVLCGSCGEPGGAGDDGVTPAAPGPLISDTDDRIEASQVTDPNLSKFKYSTAAMWRGTGVVDNGDGTSTVGTIPYNTFFGQPLCPGTKFADQPVGVGLACTAFLVAPDMVATANHCLNWWGWPWDSWKFVFDYTYPVSTWITNTRIFRPTTLLLSDSARDIALLQLDRSVPEWRTTYPLDPAGAPPIFQFTRFIDSVAAFGHGAGLALKYSPNTGPYAGAYAFSDNQFLSYLDVLEGNSGSPVFDTATSLVRGIVSGQYVDDYVQDPAGCLRLVSYSPAQYPFQNGLETSYVQPIANLIAPAGSPIEPTYRSAKTLAYAPSS